MLCRPQYGTYAALVTDIRLNEQKTFRNFCRTDTAEYDELLAWTIVFVAGQYMLATNSTRSTLSTVDKVERLEVDFVASHYKVDE